MHVKLFINNEILIPFNSFQKMPHNHESWAISCVLLFSLHGATALTTTEINAFTVTGSYDATVSVDATTYASQNRYALSLSPSLSISLSR